MSRAHRAQRLAVGLSLSVVLAACGGSSSGGGDGTGHDTDRPGATETATSGTPTVTIKGIAISPATLVINKGMKVRFVQEDPTPHNVVGSGPSEFIKSPLLTESGQSYTVTFSKAGTFDYICTIHPKMQGRVIVQ
jgi:plastocyanin